jgi:hypothetical protein
VSHLKLRPIADPFVVAAPGGARVRTRIHVDAADATVLAAVGRHLGVLAGRDLACRCAEGRLDAKGRAVSRRERKRALTAESSSRWAGALTRTSEDAWQLGWRNLVAEQRSLRARVGRIRDRLAVPAGERRGRVRGYATRQERWEKQRRLQVLEARLREVDIRLKEGRVSVCRGGTGLARVRHHLDAAGLTEDAWRGRWEARRLFVCADGEASKPWGNETIRFNPDERWVELRLPTPLVHLANRPHGRYRLACLAVFPHRGDEVAAQTESGAVRYDISYDPQKNRWYLDASWKTPDRPAPDLDVLRRQPVLAVDVNAGHLACCVVDPSGNPLHRPWTVPLDLDGLPASTRDGRLRGAVSVLLAAATDACCAALVVEDLDFADARDQGRERHGNRPTRGARGRRFRRTVAGIPTARFRGRLVQMAANVGLWVVAVDPAYTSMWGAEHWLGAVEEISPTASGHHAAAVVVGRRGLGQRARRRGRCDPTPAEHGERRATHSAVRPTATPAGAVLTEPHTRNPGNRGARGQPHQRHKTQPADRPPPATRRPRTVRSRPKPASPTATS